MTSLISPLASIAKDALEFVDVHSTEIDPGLRGLRLGQRVQDAIAILGKPDTNSTYVLSYKVPRHIAQARY